MSGPINGWSRTARISDADLRAGLQAELCRTRSESARIAHVERRPARYRSSAALEEVDLRLTDGTTLPMMFKNAAFEAMHVKARRVKPFFLHQPLREIETYRRVLGRHRLGTAMCYGAVTDARRGRYWLFIERVPGVELHQIGELATWQHVARWLAGMHLRFSRSDVTGRAQEVHALRYGRAYYRMWLERARFFAGCRADAVSARREVDWLASRYDVILERLTGLGVSFIHGEFYPSNVMIQQEPSGLRVCPVDWETAAIGPGLMDLAALITGWSDRKAVDIATAYYSVMCAEGAWAGGRETFLADLACCRIQLAVQWLGWFGSRRPRAEHARDWLGEAIRLAEQL